MDTKIGGETDTNLHFADEVRHLRSSYTAKAGSYFAGARRSFVNELPPNRNARLLEIGCGTGNTAALALAEARCGWCCGVELCEGPAAEARTKLQQVIVGDIERLELDIPPCSMDILFLSEVLEHLCNPGAVLRKLRPLMRPGALVLAGCPNVCHYSVLLMLLRGRWDYESEGILDETHVRWFSPATFRELFQTSGYVVDFVRPARPLRHKARLANALLLGCFTHLFHTQIELKAHCE